MAKKAIKRLPDEKLLEVWAGQLLDNIRDRLPAVANGPLSHDQIRTDTITSPDGEHSHTRTYGRTLIFGDAREWWDPKDPLDEKAVHRFDCLCRAVDITNAVKRTGSKAEVFVQGYWVADLIARAEAVITRKNHNTKGRPKLLSNKELNRIQDLLDDELSVPDITAAINEDREKRLSQKTKKWAVSEKTIRRAVEKLQGQK